MELDIVHDDFVLQQGPDAELGRDARGLEQGRTGLVADAHFVQDDAVEQAHVDVADGHLRVQQAAQFVGREHGETPLDMRDVQQEEKCCIQAGQARDAEAQDVACSFDGRSVLFYVR